MDRLLARSREIGPAQRGQIVQRVMVEGWSPAQAAEAFSVGEREVARWVADYRRRGMASLSRDVGPQRLPQRWARRLRSLLVRWSTRLRGRFERAEPAVCVELRRSSDDERARG